MKDIKDIYSRRKYHYKSLLEKQKNTAKLISRLRFVIFILGAIITIFLYTRSYIYLSASSFLVFLIIFIIAVKKHERLNKNYKFTEELYNINRTCCERLDGNWQKFKECGKKFINENHRFSHDLDVFGKGSIFQWINTAETNAGKNRLSEVLSNSPDKKDIILKRQKAVAELQNNIKFRQRLQAEAYFAKENENGHEISNLIDILNFKNSSIYSNKFIIMLFKILPILIIASIFFSLYTTLVFHISKMYIAYISVLFSIGLLFIDSKKRDYSLSMVYKLKDSIKAYNNIISLIYNTNFKSEHLKDLKAVFENKSNIKSKCKEFKAINDLLKIADNISERRNMVYIVLNILFLWDYQCMFAFEKWKNENEKSIGAWIDTVGEFEMLSSIAIIGFDHPDFVVPDILDAQLTIKARNMAHPLIKGKAVANDLDIENGSKVLLITGSNMSGKSTFLRTAGVNLILAYAGAPVYADYFKCSIMNIYTCMRISDNLEKNISSFYGEILRIKYIVEAAKNGENIFFLLDEIFKGTNSMDRHTGAKILINELIGFNTCGMVSTHDLELCDIENESGGKIKNYHFKEYYKDNKICFDYKLNRGVSKTRNALYLMKMAGIDTPNN
ncbi:hypothetical protein J2Z42_000426 [Clostridium algifaecis]|uniref:DNA mismatch repair proteins mutS family domain-containing protein n=1 Tax=Clostridium algifaecis TaxID=1472040 RepID=A0ABS4KQU4_9CLOT|nr:hypothetical protein [Clostridium algifaecis]